VEQEVRAHFPNTFATVIPRSVRLAEAPSHGAPIQQYDPISAGARAYEALADEFIASLGDRAPAGVVRPAVPATPEVERDDRAEVPVESVAANDPEGQF
ncbi:MAG: ParA family protein, partial [Dehalococcoidia bacterium]|nr:ParA family protein [Dehalococcoidia bacterium]